MEGTEKKDGAVCNECGLAIADVKYPVYWRVRLEQFDLTGQAVSSDSLTMCEPCALEKALTVYMMLEKAPADPPAGGGT